MANLWVARDLAGDLKLFAGKPRQVKPDKWWTHGQGRYDDYLYHIPESMFPDLLPGECRRLVLAEEK